MELADLLQKTCLIGLSYFDVEGELIKQSQLSGRVMSVDAEEGISIELQGQADAKSPAVFILPPTLSAWFNAPAGHFKDPNSNTEITNPDYLVTWDIHKTKKDTPEGQHEWWEWLPRTVPPNVGDPGSQ